MQIAETLPVFTSLAGRTGKALAAGWTAYAQWADQRSILKAAERLSGLAPHYLDDAGLGHLAARLPGPPSMDLVHRDSHILHLLPRA